MNGHVDDHGRALLPIAVAASQDGAAMPMEAWIDTGFTAQLMLPVQMIAALQFAPVGVAVARLADGRTVELPRYPCWIDWFGERTYVQVIANEGQFPLIGIALLAGHVLTIDYERCTLDLS